MEKELKRMQWLRAYNLDKVYSKREWRKAYATFKMRLRLYDMFGVE